METKMGASPSTTINSTEPTNPRTWKESSPPSRIVSAVLPDKQTTPYAPYRPECHHCNTTGCDAGDCSAFTDWDECKATVGRVQDSQGVMYVPSTESGGDIQTGSDVCAFTCPSRPVCSRVDITKCWLGNAGTDEPTYRAHWGREGSIRCEYDIGRIRTWEHVRAFKQKFRPKDNDPLWNEIMSKFCIGRTTKCLVDPTTGKKMADCPLLAAEDDGGAASYCRAWYDKLDDGTRDAVIDSICLANPGAPECKCHMRALDPVYQKIHPYLSSGAVNDACVWIPCKGGTPAFLVSSRDRDAPCPEVYCDIVYNVQAGGDVVISGNQNYLMCKPDNKPSQPEIEPYPPSNYPVLPSIEEANTAKRQTIGWGLLGAIALLVVCVILVSVLMSQRNK